MSKYLRISRRENIQLSSKNQSTKFRQLKKIQRNFAWQKFCFWRLSRGAKIIQIIEIPREIFTANLKKRRPVSMALRLWP